MSLRKTLRASATKPDRIMAMLAPVTLLEAAAGDAKGPRKFSINAYNGGAMELEGFDLPVVADLAGMKVAKSVVVNLHHDRKSIVGHVTEHVNDGRGIHLEGVVSGAGPAASEVMAAADNGFPWQASIEANRLKLEKLAAGKSATVNGQSFTGPLYIARESNLFGTAFVPHGADDSTTASIAATAAPPKESKMDEKLKAFIEECGFVAADVEANPTQFSAMKKAFDGKNAIEANGNSASLKTIDQIEAENNRQKVRVGAINEIAAREAAAHDGNYEAVENILAAAKLAIAEKLEPMQFENRLLRAKAVPTAHAPMRSLTATNRITPDVLEAAVCIYGRLGNLDKHFDEKVLNAADKRFSRGIGLNELILICARENGWRGNDMRVTPEVQNYAFGLTGPSLQAAGFSTLPTPGILSNIANKYLLEGWSGQDMAWSEICSRRSVNDFKTATSYKLSGNMKYEKVGPGGELAHGSVSEDTYTNKVDTYGKMFAITRSDYINDDLGALTSVPKELGIGANDSFNDVFWTAFLNNSTFFASGNNNVSTGGGSALSISGLSAAEIIFMNQTKPNGTPLGLLPEILLVPTALKYTARTLMQSEKLAGGSSAAPDANVYQGAFRVVSSPYMSNSTFTGYSAAAWYLLANPSRLSTIEAAFLYGKESPTVETADAAFNVLGVQMRAYHDFGVTKQEYRAGVRSNGS